MHVEVVGELDGADELIELALEVLAARLAHHEVVLEDDGHTLADKVASERALALLEGPGGGLVGHAGRQALVKGPHVPLDLAVDILDVLVGQDAAGERGVGRVGDEAVDAVGEVLVWALEDVGQVPPAVALEPLQVLFDVARGGAEDVLVRLERGLDAVRGVRAPPVPTGVAVWNVGGRSLPVVSHSVPYLHGIQLDTYLPCSGRGVYIPWQAYSINHRRLKKIVTSKIIYSLRYPFFMQPSWGWAPRTRSPGGPCTGTCWS